MGERERADVDDDFDDDAECSWCGGDGFTECNDRLGCTRRHIGDECECSACGGSGLAKDQTVW